MTRLKMIAFATLVAAGSATAVAAAPFELPAAPLTAMRATPVVNGYGPLPYGLYGHRKRFHTRRSYGTGYHGRGTRTGGPSGGLPGRS